MRNVIVTGGSRGLGLGIVRRLICEGYCAIAVARNVIGNVHPFRAGVCRAIDAELCLWRAAKTVRLEGNDEHGVGVVGMHLHRETKIGRQAFSNIVPRIAGIVAAVDPPMMLQKHPRWI